MAHPRHIEADASPSPALVGPRPRRLPGLLAVSRSTSAHRDPGLLRDLAGALRHVAHFDRVAIVLHDPSRDLMRLHTLASLHPSVVTDIELPTQESPAGIAWETQEPLLIRRIEGETRFPRVLDILRQEGMRSLCVVPLSSALRRLGGLSFASREENAFGEAEIDFLRQLSGQVALAVDNTLHHEAAQSAQRKICCASGTTPVAARRQHRPGVEPRPARPVQRHRGAPAASRHP